MNASAAAAIWGSTSPSAPARPTIQYSSPVWNPSETPYSAVDRSSIQPARELLDRLEDPLGGRQQIGTWHRETLRSNTSRSSPSIGAISLAYAASRSSYDGLVPEPKDLLFKVVTRLHRAAYDLSHGKVGGTTMGMPVLKLTTVGRKSGERRTTMLTSPLVEGDDMILVASFGGDDRHPAWYLNLVANPDVEIEIEGSKRLMRARVAEDAERARLWDAADRRARQLRRLPAQDRPRDPGRRALATLTTEPPDGRHRPPVDVNPPTPSSDRTMSGR